MSVGVSSSQHQEEGCRGQQCDEGHIIWVPRLLVDGSGLGAKAPFLTVWVLSPALDRV